MEERTKEGITKLYFVIEEQPDGVFSDDRLHGIFFTEAEAMEYFAFSRVIEDEEDEEG